MAEKIFAKGAFLKKPRDGAPAFVMGSLGIKVDEFKAFLDEYVKNNGYVDLDLLIGQGDKPYVALNNYVPEKPEVAQEQEDAGGDEGKSEIPF